jgi:hypothetical protein
VRLAWQAGLRTIAVTDHDTMASVEEATRVGRDFGLRVVAGIEITAVLEDGDGVGFSDAECKDGVGPDVGRSM